MEVPHHMHPSPRHNAGHGHCHSCRHALRQLGWHHHCHFSIVTDSQGDSHLDWHPQALKEAQLPHPQSLQEGAAHGHPLLFDPTQL